MKTPAATAMVWVKTTVNNQLNEVTATATKTVRIKDDDNGNKGNGGSGGSAAIALGQRPAWQWWRQFGESAALAVAAGLAAEAAAWQERHWHRQHAKLLLMFCFVLFRHITIL